MRLMRKNGAILVILALSLSLARGQQPAQEPAVKSPIAPPPPMQEKPPAIEAEDTVRITTNLVQIDAVVTKDNKPVTDLKTGDFEILEDGIAQPITNFSFIMIPPKAFVAAAPNVVSNGKDRVVSPPPPVRADEPHRTIALVVDDLGISFESMSDIRKQLRKFVNEELQANDLVAIIRTGGEVGALQQFTNNKEMLSRAIDAVKWHPCSRAGVSIFPSNDGGTNGVGLCSNPASPLGSTLASVRFVLNGMRDLPGRKSMVIFSENMPVDYVENALPGAPISVSPPASGNAPDPRGNSPLGSAQAFSQLGELAVRSSVVIYGVDTRGLQPLGPFASDVGLTQSQLRPTGAQPFEQLSSRAHTLTDLRTGSDLLARETGGFLIKNSNEFRLKRIADDQSGYYLLGFRPPESTFNHRFHHISVRVKRSGATVRTRSGFFGITDEESHHLELTNRDRVNIALMSPFQASDIEVHLTTVFADIAGVGPTLRSLIYFQGRDLQFLREPGGWSVANLNLAAIVFGDNGSVVQQVIQTRELRVHPDEVQRLERDGLVYQLDLPIPRAGAYQFRVAIRDEASALMGTARQFVEVPDLKKGSLVLSGITVSGDTANPATDGVQRAVKMNSPGIRRFVTGENLWFAYVIYNASIDQATGQPSLMAEARLFRDGTLVHKIEPKPVQVSGQDLQRIDSGGGIRLGGLPPGDYILQVLVTEFHGKEKPRVVSQWIDFDIVK
jgi:VWFA-related protein